MRSEVCTLAPGVVEQVGSFLARWRCITREDLTEISKKLSISKNLSELARSWFSAGKKPGHLVAQWGFCLGRPPTVQPMRAWATHAAEATDALGRCKPVPQLLNHFRCRQARERMANDELRR